MAEACAGDEGLRYEVESLLRQLSDADGFLSDPALLVAAKRLADRPGHRLIGRQLGVYHVESLLGAGGIGGGPAHATPRWGATWRSRSCRVSS